MATDRSLTTLLRALQIASNEQDISRLLGSGTDLLTLLSNPLNVTLLTAQLLSAPAIWHRPEGLQSTTRILSVFNTATVRLQSLDKLHSVVNDFPVPARLSREEWVTAVIDGADERSPRWRHVLAFSGLLLGFYRRDSQKLPGNLGWTLQNALVRAVNIALEEGETVDALAAKSIVVALSHVFELLNDTRKASINHQSLLPILYKSPFFDQDGLHSGYFLSIIDADVLETTPRKFDWSRRSPSYVRLQRMASGPLFASLGPLSRLTAFSLENVHDSDLLAVMVEDLAAFTRTLCVQWRQNKLSEVDITEEKIYLGEETLKHTVPLLWRVLRSSMFAIVVILKSVIGRVLGDTLISMDTGVFVATQTLHILRNLYFISSRLEVNAFSEYNFVYLTAIDILSQFPVQAEAFLREHGPSETGSIPSHPFDRCHDLYFLNTAEHFAFVLDPRTSEELLIGVAKPYLGLGGDQRLLEVFEAAHSVILAVFAAPQNTDVVVRHIEVYFNTLSHVFPHNLSPRQFRMAVKTLINVITPPSPISKSQPLLASSLLEMVHSRSAIASTEPSLQANNGPIPEAEPNPQSAVSEQAVLILALVDALPFLPVSELEEWLPIVAQSIQTIRDEQMQQLCSQRLWEVLTSGEMDVDRSAVCVAWWSTRGGRELVLGTSDTGDNGPFMSGGLSGEVSKL